MTLQNYRPDEFAAEQVESALAPYVDRRDQLHGALKETAVETDDDEIAALDRITLAKALLEESAARAADIAAPYERAHTTVKSRLDRWRRGLQFEVEEVTRKVSAHRDRRRAAAEKARREQEERERELRRAAKLDVVEERPAVKRAPVKLESTRGDYQGVAFDRKTIEVTIDDPRALPDTILKSEGVTKALETACRQLARLDKNIPGATITEGVATSVKVKR